MAAQNRKSRGRPKGSGKDDTQLLDRIADAILADPALRPTTVVRQAGVDNPSDVRRLQAKWKASKQLLLDAARSRLAWAKSAELARSSVANVALDELRRISGFKAQDMLRDALGPVEELRRLIRSADILKRVHPKKG